MFDVLAGLAAGAALTVEVFLRWRCGWAYFLKSLFPCLVLLGLFLFFDFPFKQHADDEKIFHLFLCISAGVLVLNLIFCDRKASSSLHWGRGLIDDATVSLGWLVLSRLFFEPFWVLVLAFISWQYFSSTLAVWLTIAALGLIIKCSIAFWVSPNIFKLIKAKRQEHEELQKKQKKSLSEATDRDEEVYIVTVKKVKKQESKEKERSA